MDDMLDYQSIAIMLLFAIITLLLVMVFNSGLRSRSKLPPGPWRIPVIGNLHHLGELPHRSLRCLAEKYGPLMHLQLGQIPTIVVSSPEVASEIMKTHDLEFCNRPSTPVFKKFSYNGSDIAISKYGEHYWRQMRRLGILEIFSTKKVQSFRNVREDEVHVLNQSIIRSCTQAPQTEHNEIYSASVDERATTSCFFDIHETTPEPILKAIPVVLFLCIAVWRRTGSNEPGLSLDKEEDFLDVLLKSQKDSANLGFSLTRDHIKAILMLIYLVLALRNIFLDGTDTSAATLERAMTELMRCPSTMKKVQDKVLGIIGNKGNVEENDLQQLQYLKLVICETLRLHCIVPFLLPRESSKDCKVFGYDISKNTRFLVNAWAIARDPKLWENPEVFMPGRFEGSTINYKGQHFEFIPFGAIRRMCPGMQLGIVTVEIALANILYHFNWGLPFRMCYEDIDMTEIFGVVLHKKSPVCLEAKPVSFLV
ncbi:LOW QUALITY PROTEIN: cytochrome P450 71AP13-like [Dioscorea cayenensis subsp. rotundata]|uniref:LOW QUALITY PROTEIN: cytochrome P450 71AP13-like n=1 Tax=Dioscorea cayennensis subsp. rotundata TaxID=55577 RepID=A0AB40D334_DIOCR|nr:LOW QUALITY PROTEIN: cytochrome P450 71AP13-like [Dioscorea cayenensis subsp. rotundata]